MLRLYHAGFQVIPSPDVRYGRKNADFGQGFYLTAEKAAAHLRFLGADELSAAELSAFREAVAREERAYQEVFAGTLSKLLEED